MESGRVRQSGEQAWRFIPFFGTLFVAAGLIGLPIAFAFQAFGFQHNSTIPAIAEWIGLGLLLGLISFFPLLGVGMLVGLICGAVWFGFWWFVDTVFVPHASWSEDFFWDIGKRDTGGTG